MTETNDTTAELKALRERAGLSVREMAKRVGMSSSGYLHYETPARFKGGAINMNVAKLIAEALAPEGIPTSDVMKLAGINHSAQEIADDQPQPENTTLVPVYDVSASAGGGAVIEGEDHVTNLAFSRDYLREMTQAKGRDLAVIRVKGDSMEPTLLDDDLVMIDRTKHNLDFDGLFVLRVGEALHVKRIGRGSTRGAVTVISDNRVYPPVQMAREDIDVIGKVLWYGRKV